MTKYELRQNAARVVNVHLQTQHTTRESAAFVVGYLKACRDAEAITVAECDLAAAYIQGDATKGDQWWREYGPMSKRL